jgi:hypothetical protein
MNISDTKAGPRTARGPSRYTRLSMIGALVCSLVASQALGTDESDYHFVAEGTLGDQFYDLDAPYDTSNVAGFFEQYRYIRDQGATLPYFLDLLHFDVGVQRSDDTYLIPTGCNTTRISALRSPANPLLVQTKPSDSDRARFSMRTTASTSLANPWGANWP